MLEHHPATPLLKSFFSLPRGAKESNDLHMHGTQTHTHIHVNTRPNSSAKLNPERITKNGQKITKKKKTLILCSTF